MAINYSDPIKGVDLFSLPDSDITAMAEMIINCQKKRSVTPLAQDVQESFIRSYLRSPLASLIKVHDDSKFIAFIILAPVVFWADEGYSKEAKDWLISEGVDITKVFSKHHAVDTDYNGQGITTEMKKRCNAEAKKDGFVGNMVWGMKDKVHYDHAINTYPDIGATLKMSDIDGASGTHGKIGFATLV